MTLPWHDLDRDREVGMSESHHSVHPAATCETAVGVLRENAELRGVLWEEWESNHFEHCGRDWPHPKGKPCYWPPPEILTPARGP